MHLKRILALLLAFLFLFTFVACDEEEPEASESESVSEDASESSTKKHTNNVTTDKILKENLKKYQFVVGRDATKSIARAAEGVSAMAAKKWKSNGTVEKDSYSKAENEDFEVLVGNTDRPESKQYIASLKKGEGGYAIINGKIVIAGYSDNETITAMNLFYTNVMLLLNASSSVYLTSDRNFTDYLADHISIMSFNVYVGIGSDANKRENVFKIIRAYNPDIFGVQEASSVWQAALKIEFKDEYEIIGEPRENGGEAVQIFIRKSKFEVASSGTKWLTSTPDVVSKTPGAECYRNVTYAALGTADGKVFNYVNTHLDHVGNESVRVAQVGYLGQILDKYTSTDFPTIVTGDFNMPPNSSSYNKMVGLGYKPSYELATKNYSSGKSTFKSGGVIDYCFISDSTDVETYIYKVCDENMYGENSDHNAVYTIIKY